MIKFWLKFGSPSGYRDFFWILHCWQIRKVVINRRKPAVYTHSPDGGTGNMCLGESMHCPCAPPFFSILWYDNHKGKGFADYWSFEAEPELRLFCSLSVKYFTDVSASITSWDMPCKVYHRKARRPTKGSWCSIKPKTVIPVYLIYSTINFTRLLVTVGVASWAWSTHATVSASLLPAVHVRVSTHAHVSVTTYRGDVYRSRPVGASLLTTSPQQGRIRLMSGRTGGFRL